MGNIILHTISKRYDNPRGVMRSSKGFSTVIRISKDFLRVMRIIKVSRSKIKIVFSNHNLK